MKSFKKFFLVSLLVFSLFAKPVTPVNAQSLFGFNDPPGCGGDNFLPNLVICGRNPTSAGANCSQFAKQCTLGDLVETGSRALVWIISIALLIVPLLVMYYGAMIIYERNITGNLFKFEEIRKKFTNAILYFILMLAAWLIVRTVVDIFQVEDRVPSFLIDEQGNQIKARSFNTN